MSDNNMPAIIRQYPAPRPGMNGATISLEALAVYCKYYGYRVVRLRGDEIEIAPNPKGDGQSAPQNQPVSPVTRTGENLNSWDGFPEKGDLVGGIFFEEAAEEE